MRFIKDLLSPWALLTFMSLMVMPAYGLAETPTVLSGVSGSVTILHQPSGIDYYYDLNRNSATVYPVFPGVRWYSAQDRHGKTTQGYLFDPMPRTSFGEPFSTLPSVLDNPYHYDMPASR